MTAEHLPLLVDLDSDAAVLRYIIGRARTPDEARAFWGPKCAELDADRHGLGWWVGFSGDDFLGWWDASPSPEAAAEEILPDEAELGWRLARRHWGAGLATEGARCLVQHAFGTIGVERLWAETMAVNLGSRGVMRKLGMRQVSTHYPAWAEPIEGSDQGEVVYELTRADWQESPTLVS